MRIVPEDRDEALELAFPGCAVKRTTVYLDREQVKLIEQRSRVSFEGSMLYPYRAMRDGKLVGTAYFDTHRVRSKRETLMVVVGARITAGALRFPLFSFLLITAAFVLGMMSQRQRRQFLRQ